jgi:hypothetical protein
MPVQFLTPTQVAQYGRYSQEPSQAQLAKYFHLDDRDHEKIRTFDKAHTRLGFAIQLGTVRFLGTFISNLAEVPQNIVSNLGQQLNIEPCAGNLSHPF